MANGKRESTTWRDVKGFTTQVRFYVDGSLSDSAAHGAASAVINAITAVTNAGFQSASGPATSLAGPVVYGTAAQYIGVQMKLVLTFSGADGSLHRYKIPAPKIASFEVDQVTADASETNLAALIAAMLANVVTSSGAALTSYVSGSYKSGKQPRRLNSYILVPELDEPAS